jgi:hypothetical protein
MTPHPASLTSTQLLQQCATRRQRRSGPGGQHRNKVETAVVITHIESGVQGAASERRDQQQNKAVALFRLRVKLALEVRCPAGDHASQLWTSRCQSGKIAINPQHEDFPSLLAEVLDQLQTGEGELAAVLERLRVTSSQLVKFLKLEPAGMMQLNDLRAAHDRPPLR